MAREKENLLLKGHKKGDVFVLGDVIKLACLAAAHSVDGVVREEERLTESILDKKKVIIVEGINGRLKIGVSIKVYLGYNLIAVSEEVQDVVIEMLTTNFNIEEASVQIVIRGLEILPEDGMEF